VINIRESFGAKVLAALLGTVGLLLMVTFGVVRIEMSRQVDLVAARTVRNAGTLFEQLNELQRQQAEQLTIRFTESRRALALLDQAIKASDVDYLAEQVSYELELASLALEDVLLVFTDEVGEPVLTMVGGQRITDGDPANIGPLALELVESDSLLVTSGYRVVGGRLFNVQSLYVELAFRPIGTITFGLALEQDDVEQIGSMGNFQACLVVEGDCVVRTSGVNEEMGSVLLSATEQARARRAAVGGADWSIQSEPLMRERPDEGTRVIAVPLDEVLAPFARIQLALVLGGAGALVLAAMLGAVLSRSLTRPVRDLVAAVGRVAEGDYGAEVQVTSHDEMGTLATAFNEMTHGLLVREQYRSVLNKIVSQDVAEELMKGDVELGGENREVSVLFADIRGFTPLTEGMEPQEVIGLLNDCMEHLSEAVDAEGGVVDKFIGDEIMAVFGAPVAQDDHARSAVRAAIRMRDGMSEMNAQREARGEGPLSIGIGINTGVAVAGNMGSADRLNYTVLGETVNLASRLTDLASFGEILVSGQTLASAGPGVVSRDAGDRSLKGFSSEVEVAFVESMKA